MKLKILFILILAGIFFGSCQKREDKKVTYIATNASSEFTLSYRNATGNLQTENISMESTQDKWQYSFITEQGSIIYLSGKYSNITSSLTLIITIDGKVFKQSSSVGDTLQYLTVSGVVPY